jgi:Dynein light chain type 1
MPLMWLQLIKDTMDKKFGPAWHVVVGKGFSYDVQYEVRCWCLTLGTLCLGTLRCPAPG